MIIYRDELRFLNNQLTHEALKNCDRIEVNYYWDSIRIKEMDSLQRYRDYLFGKNSNTRELILCKMQEQYSILWADDEGNSLTYKITEDEFYTLFTPYKQIYDNDILDIVNEIKETEKWIYNGDKEKFKNDYGVYPKELTHILDIEGIYKIDFREDNNTIIFMEDSFPF
jgi:replicative superfamily II helicase